VVDPCIPTSWPEYTIAWRFGRTRYEIVVKNPERRCRGVGEAKLDGLLVDARAIPLVDDGATHQVRLVLGDPNTARPVRGPGRSRRPGVTP
jgi:cyclic beta-1,2-glucan synthetase